MHIMLKLFLASIVVGVFTFFVIHPMLTFNYALSAGFGALIYSILDHFYPDNLL